MCGGEAAAGGVILGRFKRISERELRGRTQRPGDNNAPKPGAAPRRLPPAPSSQRFPPVLIPAKGEHPKSGKNKAGRSLISQKTLRLHFFVCIFFFVLFFFPRR